MRRRIPAINHRAGADAVHVGANGERSAALDSLRRQLGCVDAELAAGDEVEGGLVG
jgi:hypothetical protein